MNEAMLRKIGHGIGYLLVAALAMLAAAGFLAAARALADVLRGALG